MILRVMPIEVLWLQVCGKLLWWSYLVAKQGAMHLVVVWQSEELVRRRTELEVTAELKVVQSMMRWLMMGWPQLQLHSSVCDPC